MVLSERKLALIENILAIEELGLLEEISLLIKNHVQYKEAMQVQETKVVYASAEEAKAIEEGIVSMETEPAIPYEEVQKLINSWR